MYSIHNNDFINRVTVQTRTVVEDVLGPNETWTNGPVLWASCSEIDYDTIGQVGVTSEMDNNNSDLILMKITFRGRRSFSIPDTRFTWRGRTFEPYLVRNLSRSDTWLTYVLCHEITELLKGQGN